MQACRRFQSPPLLVTNSEKSWLKAKKIETDSLRTLFNAAEGDQRIAVNTAWALTRSINGKQQKIAGDI